MATSPGHTDQNKRPPESVNNKTEREREGERLRLVISLIKVNLVTGNLDFLSRGFWLDWVYFGRLSKGEHKVH